MEEKEVRKADRKESIEEGHEHAIIRELALISISEIQLPGSRAIE
jgi:hypothetical protein